MMRTGGVNISDSPAFAGADYYSYKQKGCAIAAQPQPVEKEISFCQNAREQPRKLVRAQAARALPFPFGRKRKQKGPFCTALRQQKDRDTLNAVRRDAQKLAASRRSDNLCARFFTARDAVKKSPHEPRSKRSAMLPRPAGSFSSRRQLAVQVICVKPYFSHRNLLRNRSIGPRCTSHALLSSA